MHDCGDPETGTIVYLLAELRSEERGAVHEIGSRARVLGVEGTELTLAVTGCGGEAILSCPQSLVVPERRALAARRRLLRAGARAANAQGAGAPSAPRGQPPCAGARPRAR